MKQCSTNRSSHVKILIPSINYLIYFWRTKLVLSFLINFLTVFIISWVFSPKNATFCFFLFSEQKNDWTGSAWNKPVQRGELRRPALLHISNLRYLYLLKQWTSSLKILLQVSQKCCTSTTKKCSCKLLHSSKKEVDAHFQQSWKKLQIHIKVSPPPFF